MAQRIEGPFTPAQPAPKSPATEAPAPKAPAPQTAAPPAPAAKAAPELNLDLDKLGKDLFDEATRIEKKVVDFAEHVIPKLPELARDVLTHIARDLGFEVKDPTPPVPAEKTIPAPKDGPINPKYPNRPHGPLQGPIMHHEWWVTEGLGRGDQPTKADAAYLKEQGFKSIINLRDEDNADEQMAKDNGLNYLHVNWVDKTAPTTEQIKQILDFATDPKNGPAFIHCLAGRNRTSVAVAAYQMAVEGKSFNDTMKEAYDWGLHTPSQVEFLKGFYADLKAGKIEGYPLKPIEDSPEPPPEPPGPPPKPPKPPAPPHVPIPEMDPEQVRLFTMPEASAWPIEDAISRAKSSVELSVYMLTSPYVVNALKDAASKGIKVRVMLEPQAIGPKPEDILKQIEDLKAAGIDAQVTPPKYDSSNNYDHAKFMIVDDKDLLFGTGNLVKSSLGGSSSQKDRDFWIEDTHAESVAEADQLFEADWNRQDTSNIEFKNLWVTPENADDRLLGLVDGAKDQLLVYQQSLTNGPMIDKLIDAKKRGVDVQVLFPTPEKGQKDGNAKAIQALKDAGVTVKELPKYYLHAKVVVADDKAFVGSQNFTLSGLTKNREVGELIDHQDVVSQLVAQFQKDMATGVDPAPIDPSTPTPPDESKAKPQ